MFETVDALHALNGLTDCGWRGLLHEFTAKSFAHLVMLPAIIIMLGLGFDEAVLGLATSFLKSADLIVELVHLGLSVVHEKIILVDLLLKRQKNALLNGGAVETVNVVARDC